MDAGVPVTRGSYLLVARLAYPAEIAVGRLGTSLFPAGWYAYAGSALGPGGRTSASTGNRLSYVTSTSL